MKFTHGSLFSGIGGFDIASEEMVWENVFHCEINPFGRKVLNYYWPNAISYEDITKTDFSIWRGKIDLLSGGFPCQPFSAAGKRLGTEDERHLWPEYLRAIREISPIWVVGENVRGLVNWSGGLVFEEVCADLEAEGYEVQPFLLPASGTGAPHQRERIFFVAHSNSARLEKKRTEQQTARLEQYGKLDRTTEHSERKSNGGDNARESKRNGVDMERNCVLPERRKQGSNDTFPSSITRDAPNSSNIGCHNGGNHREKRQVPYNQKRNTSKGKPTRNERLRWVGKIRGFRDATDSKRLRSPREKHGEKKPRQYPKKNKRIGWRNFPTQSPICSRNDGFSGRLDGITFPKWRNESIKAYGNAVVPAVIVQIFKAIKEYEDVYA
jgi:DNA (cytosine-5)-methyltransferase 1